MIDRKNDDEVTGNLKNELMMRSREIYKMN